MKGKLIIVTNSIGINTDFIDYIWRNGNSWEIEMKNGRTFSIWDEWRDTLEKLINEYPEDY